MDAGAIAYVLTAFFLAAFTKGVTGLGFSTLCLALLAVVVEPTVGIPLVIGPSLCSNVLVMIGAGHIWPALRRFWPIYLAALPGLGLGLWVLKTMDGSVGRSVLGGVLIAYALWAIFNTQVRLQQPLAQVLVIPVGFITGVINGVTGSQVMPILPYLLALDLERDEFVTAINLSFTLSSLVMLIGLIRLGLIQVSLSGIALSGVLFVALGISLGTRSRKLLAPDYYKRLVLILLVILGISLILKS